MGAHKHNPNIPIIGQMPRRIVVGTPAGDMMKSLTGQCKEMLMSVSMNAGLVIGAVTMCGTYVEMGQNQLVKTVLDGGGDALLLIDSDMLFPGDALVKLLRRNQPIVGAGYRRRMKPRRCNVKLLDGTWATGKETGLQEVEAVASGMLLIRRSVLSSMPYPWFFNTYGEKFEDFVGNDVNFCLKARAAGHKVFCDFDLSRDVRHIADEYVGWEDPE